MHHDNQLEDFFLCFDSCARIEQDTHDWQGKINDRFEHSRSEDQIHHAIESALKFVDFDYYALCLYAPWPLTRKKSYVLTNFPATWETRRHDACCINAGEARYINIDPVTRRTRQYPPPVEWSDALSDEIPTFWQEAQSSDLRYGCSLQVATIHGISGIMYFGRSSTALSTDRLRKYETTVRWITDATIQAVVRNMLPKIVPGIEISLTDREIEILKWMADGKTASEIAIILLISVYTVNFHVKNVIIKLGTTNKTAAVARAAMLGLIT